MATLIASSKSYFSETMLTYAPDQAVDKFIETVFRTKAEQSKRIAASRLLVQNGRYMYTPSNEYTKAKSVFIRAKFHLK